MTEYEGYSIRPGWGIFRGGAVPGERSAKSRPGLCGHRPGRLYMKKRGAYTQRQAVSRATFIMSWKVSCRSWAERASPVKMWSETVSRARAFLW